MIDTDNFEKRVKGIRNWKGPEVDKLEAVHMIPYVIESYELITDLFTEVERLREELNRAYDTIDEYEEVIEPERLDEIKRLEKRIEDMQKGAPRCSCPRISVNGNGGGGSIMVDVTFEDGEEYIGCLDRR